ncbi:MAG: hypothetical protein ACKODX_18655 [Gemmata sp.]
MPTLISDPPQVVYLVLFAAVVATGAVAAQRQDRRSAMAFFAALGLLVLLFVLDRLLDSPREAAVKTSQAMAVAADTNKPDEFAKHVADKLVYHGEGAPRTATGDEVKNSQFWQMLRQYNIHVAVWGFGRDDVRQIDGDTVELGFMAKGEVRGSMEQQQLYVRGTFKRQPDGTMKMTGFRTFDAIDHSKPFNIPGFP